MDADKRRDGALAMAALGFTHYSEETYRQLVVRYARRHRAEEPTECVAAFDFLIEEGLAEQDAAFCALYEYDCLDFFDDKKPVEEGTAH